MKMSGATAALLTCLVSLAAGVDRASGATTEIGAVGEIRDGALPSAIAASGFTVQLAEASGTYAVPRGYETITAWRHSAGTKAGTLTFKVYRPTGATRQFLTVASDTRTVTAKTVQSFPVQIPVRPGDRIGLSSDDDQMVQLAYESADPADQLGFFGSDPAPGTTRATDGEPFEDFKLDVAATVQSDPDGPGPGPPPPGGGPAPGSPPATSPLAAATKLRLLPTAFAAARRGPSALTTSRRASGAKVSYELNVRAAVRFTVRQARPGRRKGTGSTTRCVAETERNHKAAKCTRTVTLRGGFTQMAKAAANSFGFSGRLNSKPLKPGAYTLVATPSASGKTGKPASSRFRIIR